MAPRARCEMVSSAMSELVAAYGLTHDEGCAFLVDDVVALRSIFSSIVDCGYVRPRLDVFQTNACRIFHLDAVMARLICTYRDHATQYDTGHAGEDPE